MIFDLLNTPFGTKGRGPECYDCYGVVLEVYKRNGIILKDFDIDSFDFGTINSEIVTQVSSGFWKVLPSPEYLCVIKMKQHPVFTQHLGVFLGKDKFIHAVLDRGVVIDSINSSCFKNCIKGFYKYVGPS